MDSGGVALRHISRLWMSCLHSSTKVCLNDTSLISCDLKVPHVPFYSRFLILIWSFYTSNHTNHLINVVHSLYGGGSPHLVALDGAEGTSSSLSTPATPSIPSSPSIPQFSVPPSPPAPATPRHTLNTPSAPMPISQRYRPYSVTSPWGAPTPPSPGYRGFSLFAPSPSPAGHSVPPNTPVPLPPPSPQPLSLSSSRAPHQPSSTPPLVVPSSLRSNTRQAAFASRIPPSRYLILHLHVSLCCTHRQIH